MLDNFFELGRSPTSAGSIQLGLSVWHHHDPPFLAKDLVEKANVLELPLHTPGFRARGNVRCVSPAWFRGLIHHQRVQAALYIAIATIFTITGLFLVDVHLTQFPGQLLFCFDTFVGPPIELSRLDLLLLASFVLFGFHFLSGSCQHL